MVKQNFSKNILSTVIAVFVITVLLFGNIACAKEMKVSTQDLERIKRTLDMASTFTNIMDLLANNNNLATILNRAIKVGQTSTDLTYGLLILSAINEMEFIDLVISQDYKDKEKEYFNKVIDEKTNLFSYWKDVGFDIPKVALGYITGPIGGLTLNTFSITGKIVLILAEFETIRKGKQYDGLWRYFDERRNGESHEGAWELAEPQIGWAINSLGFHRDKDRIKDKIEIENQFAALYENWSPYVTPFGIKKEYKEQLADELADTLVTAIEETSNLAEEKKEPSWLAKQMEEIRSLVASLKENVQSLISQVNPFSAGPILEFVEVGDQQTESPLLEEPELSKVEPPSISTTTELVFIPEPEPIFQPEPEPELQPATSTIPTPESTQATSTAPVIEPTPQPIFCEKEGQNPKRFRVLINEVAWMGSENSSNNEWIELKNIWGIPVKLQGWQLQDKDRQIKIIFGENDTIPAQGYYLLERTNDDSLPDTPANLIYTGALGNTDEALYLFDDQCNLEDEVLANPEWPAGDNSLKKPLQRFDVLSWYSGVATPNSENSHPPAILSNPNAPTAPQAPPLSSAVYPEIIITETYTGSPGNQKDDFIELYNPNLETISLTDWYLQRKTENAQDFSSYVPQNLLSGKTIQAQNYFLIANSSSTFAASADVLTAYSLTKKNALVLKNPNRDIIDRVFTGNPSSGKSYGREWSSNTQNYIDNFGTQIPTPKAQNNNLETDENGEEENEEDEEQEETTPISVVINEIAWAGTKANYSDEWLELFVNSTTTLDGWKILGMENGTSTLEIPLSGYFPSLSYILIERSDDDTVPNTAADLFFTGALDNDGMKLELLDPAGDIIDSVDCENDWFAGEASPDYISMERINPLTMSDIVNWTSNNLITKNGLDAEGNQINGTPKAENSVTKSFTEIIGGLNIDGNLTLTLLGSPYLVEGSINVSMGAKLTIEPGVTIKFKHSSTWKSELKVEGELEAMGGDDEEEKIVFTSFYDAADAEPSAGDWEWLYFKNAQAKLENIIVKYAGRKEGNPPFSPLFTRGAVYIDGGNIEIKNSAIEKSQTLGVWLTNSTTALIDNVEFSDAEGDWEKAAAVYIEKSSSIVRNSTFKNNKIGIWIEDGNNPSIENNIFEGNEIPIRTSTLLPSFSQNTAQNNILDGILVAGLGFSESITQISWQKTSLPYVLESSATVSAGQILNIEPGVTIKLKGGGRIYIDGTLRALGTSTEKIIFTSFGQETPGAWNFIEFSASSINSILDNVIVDYGGWYRKPFKSGAVKIESNDVVVANSLFENNWVAGLELENCTTTIKNTEFRNHQAKYNYNMEDSKGLLLRNATPIFSDVVFKDNYYGIYTEAGECPNLAGASFSANSIDIWPSTCQP